MASGQWPVRTAGGGPPFTRALYPMTVFCSKKENGGRKSLSGRDLRFPDFLFLQVRTHPKTPWGRVAGGAGPAARREEETVSMRHGDDEPLDHARGLELVERQRRGRPGSAGNPEGRGPCGRRLRRSSSLCPLNTASSSLLAFGRNPSRRGPTGSWDGFYPPPALLWT